MPSGGHALAPTRCHTYCHTYRAVTVSMYQISYTWYTGNTPVEHQLPHGYLKVTSRLPGNYC